MHRIKLTTALLAILLSAPLAQAQELTVSGRIVDDLAGPLSAADHGAGLVVYRINPPYQPEYVNATDCWSGQACPDSNGEFTLNLDQYGSPLRPGDTYQVFAYANFGLADWKEMVANSLQKFVVAIDPILLFDSDAFCTMGGGQAACTVTIIRKFESWERNPTAISVLIFGSLYGPNVTGLSTVIPFSTEKIQLLRNGQTVTIYLTIPEGAPVGMEYTAKVFAGKNRWHVYQDVNISMVKP